MTISFVAIDVETANSDVSSICQIGMAVFENGKLIKEWSSLIDPEDYFSGMNIRIHGIDEEAVKGQPKLFEVSDIIHKFTENLIIVSHSHFDRISIKKAFARYKITPLSAQWLDSARVARRAWPELSSKVGYGLFNLCKNFGYKFAHHDALEDAKAAGYILNKAISESNEDLIFWLHRVEKPIDLSPKPGIKKDGNPEGNLYGEVLVFTGSLMIPRREAADLAAIAGCSVVDNITKKITILVVGDQDIKKLSGHQKSSKHRKVEAMIEEGYSIRIIGETDFLDLIGK